MKHISVTKKLWLGVASIVMGSVIIVGHAGYNSAAHQKSFNQQDSMLSQRLDQASQWAALSQVNIVRTQAAIASSESQEAAEFAAQIKTTHTTLQTLQQALKDSSTSSQDEAALQQLARLQQTMQAHAEHAQQLKANAKLDEAREVARNSYGPAAEAYTQALSQYTHQQAQHLAQMRADMGAARQGVVRAAAINMVFLLLELPWALISSSATYAAVCNRPTRLPNKLQKAICVPTNMQNAMMNLVNCCNHCSA